MERQQDPTKRTTPQTIIQFLTLLVSVLALVNSVLPLKDVFSPFRFEMEIPKYVYLKYDSTSSYIHVLIPITINNVSKRDGIIHGIRASTSPADCDRCKDFSQFDIKFITKTFISNYPEERDSNIPHESILPLPLERHQSSSVIIQVSVPKVLDDLTKDQWVSNLFQTHVSFLINDKDRYEFYKTPIKYEITKSMIDRLDSSDSGELIKVEVENYISN